MTLAAYVWGEWVCMYRYHAICQSGNQLQYPISVCCAKTVLHLQVWPFRRALMTMSSSNNHGHAWSCATALAALACPARERGDHSSSTPCAAVQPDYKADAQQLMSPTAAPRASSSSLGACTYLHGLGCACGPRLARGSGSKLCPD